MSASPPKLYTPQVLALATGLARWPHDPAMPLQGRARSQSCGSTLALSLELDEQGRIAGLGVAAQACAIGQASAAIFAAAAEGKNGQELASSLSAIEDWLSGKGEMPAWPGLDAIAAATAYPARHGAVLLPWKAALDALP
ncbi:iron-sulfur cluster assembly scaffold protein [Novosphingobium sp. TH158]|uniref:iron-sulfur cluster assembly scaffold protein n=1 Tax=Novosphingobium sp. TH158 TaxID=2067455 RepID=UPI000C7CBD95|nr:iron-sulfur cluster assembly scaffold protein [Novosphingobium sp. TH158]PLK25887.1 Fe-S cluster protein [Novosphingobium sp. TH158]